MTMWNLVLCYILAISKIRADCQDFKAEPCQYDRHYLSIGGKRFPYLTNSGAGSIENINSDRVEQVILIQHGGASDADNYFCIMQNSLRVELCGGQPLQDCSESGRFYVLAPEFIRGDRQNVSDSSLLIWDYGWAKGEFSLNSEVSSFDVYDTIVQRSGALTIKFAGHSSGAQTLARYAVASNSVTSVKFFIANPSSSPYFLQNSRPTKLDPKPCDNNDTISTIQFSFAEPTVSTCETYDSWPYGLSNLNQYVAKHGVSRENMLARFSAENLQLISASADNCCRCEAECCSCEDPNGLDINCGANAQGRCRMERIHAYRNHLLEVKGENTAPMVMDLPGVQHDGCVVYRHETVRKCIFKDDCPSSSSIKSFCNHFFAITLLMVVYMIK